MELSPSLNPESKVYLIIRREVCSARDGAELFSLIIAKLVSVYYSSIVTVTCSRAEWLRLSSSFKLTLVKGRQNKPVGDTGVQCLRPVGKKRLWWTPAINNKQTSFNNIPLRLRSKALWFAYNMTRWMFVVKPSGQKKIIHAFLKRAFKYIRDVGVFLVKIFTGIYSGVYKDQLW